MAGAGYKLFNTGDVLTAAQVNTYLMEQTIMVFANAAARDTALSGVVAQGMQCFLKDTNTMQYYSGSAWVTLSTGGDITSVVAGTGISGGGTSGDVTITNSMATAIDAKGDLVAGTANDTFARLAVGNNGETLVADSSASTGLRWQSVYNGNAIINGAFDVWQRGTSGTASGFTAGIGYNADRWQNYYAGTMTVSRQATNDTTNLPFIQYCARVQRNSGQTNTGGYYHAYTMETTDSIRFAGRTVTLSFYARAGANYSATSSALNVELATGTGTDGNVLFGFTGGATPINTSVTLTTTWQRFQVTATLASNIAQIGSRIYAIPTGTAGANDYFEITGVQLELGSIATTFKRSSGGTLAGELAACQRYYQRITPSAAGSRLGVGFATSTTQTNILIFYPVTMRTSPTALEQSGTASDYSVAHQATSTVLSTVPTFQIADTTYINVAFTVASGLTAGNGLFGRAVNTSAYLGWSAEL